MDYKGLSLYEFFINSPYCAGSPNGTYVEGADGEKVQQGIKYRLLDNARDAKIALTAAKRRTEAQMSVMTLDEATMVEVAAVLGIHGEPDDQMKFDLLNLAGKKPIDYFAALNNGDRPVRAIVRKAIADKLFSTRGSIIYWDKTVIGATEDEAVAKLID